MIRGQQFYFFNKFWRINFIFHISAQPGPQSTFLASPASVAIFGGAAGGGKSYALLIEVLRHYNNPQFKSIIFRRNTTNLRNPGGLWDTSLELYSRVGAGSKQAFLEWQFPSGATLKMAHLENRDTVYSYQGAQIPLIMWDELTHFEESQFWYMFSRLRSVSGVPGYMRATCNPDCDSWVRRLVDWWIGDDGFPIQERSGVLRWFVRIDDSIMWADSAEELIKQYGAESLPKSFTFIPAKLSDNRILMEKDPSYAANLRALSRVERMRLLDGNWNVRPSAGMYFQRGWFEVLESVNNVRKTKTVRYWDRAATKVSESNKDPDWTVGLKMSHLSTGLWVVEHIERFRGTPLEVERVVKNVTQQDGPHVTVCIEQDPGSAGVADADNYTRLLAGFNIRVRKPTKDKLTRALPVSAQSEANNVKILRGTWNDAFFTEIENFDGQDTGHDDQVDAFSGAFNELCEAPSMFDTYR